MSSALLLLLLLVCATSASPIKRIIVLMLENRSFDHLLGFHPGVNGLTGKEWNALNTSNPSSHRVYVNNDAPYINECDPDHSTLGTTQKIFGEDAVKKNNYTVASMSGFVERENGRGNAKRHFCDVMSAFTPERLPVLSALVEEFAVFDRFFCSHAGPTWPNRLFFMSGTSAGLTSTGPWYRNVPGALFPQKTIFDQVLEAGLEWKSYYNDTPWEMFLESLAHRPEHFFTMQQFYEDAKTGNLPNFAFINPRAGINVTEGLGPNDMHPDHDVALGEQVYKDIYEALRASPQWMETLFIVTFDEHGGFYDHVPTPLGVPPPGDGEASYPTPGVKFDRLGIRIPTLAISPWLPKGLVVSAPPAAQKPFPNSEYEATSIISTVRKLLGINLPPLTKRDAWSATFEHLFDILPAPRTDCPLHLPDAPPPSQTLDTTASKPVNDLQSEMMTVLAHLAHVPYPDHVKTQEQVSKWASAHFENHATRTKHWKNSKLRKLLETEGDVAAQYHVVVQALGKPDWDDNTWNVNHVPHFPIRTISTRKLVSELEVPTTDKKTHEKKSVKASIPYCLDAGEGIKENNQVVISVCYPSAAPEHNRDRRQQWVWGTDSTIRPHSNQSLCLTVDKSFGTSHVSLKTCDQSALQHWSYDGPAPGNPGGGGIYFGASSLGVITK